jgi:hypothetical protein
VASDWKDGDWKDGDRKDGDWKDGDGIDGAARSAVQVRAALKVHITTQTLLHRLYYTFCVCIPLSMIHPSIHPSIIHTRIHIHTHTHTHTHISHTQMTGLVGAFVLPLQAVRRLLGLKTTIFHFLFLFSFFLVSGFCVCAFSLARCLCKQSLRATDF